MKLEKKELKLAFILTILNALLAFKVRKIEIHFTKNSSNWQSIKTNPRSNEPF